MFIEKVNLYINMMKKKNMTWTKVKVMIAMRIQMNIQRILRSSKMIYWIPTLRVNKN